MFELHASTVAANDETKAKNETTKGQDYRQKGLISRLNKYDKIITRMETYKINKCRLLNNDVLFSLDNTRNES